VAAILVETKLDPSSLCLEITESALIDDVSGTIRQVARLHELGVKFAIDDFGTGWSSLGQITKLAPDWLKVDQSFIGRLGQDKEARAIVASVIGLAGALGIQLIAEGVETEEQATELRALGCEFAQGFLFSRPLPADEIQAWMTEHGDGSEGRGDTSLIELNSMPR
jgi:EAL domain-containing protein (putative c-di-GMP-specific phosphodiesterase class I)